MPEPRKQSYDTRRARRRKDAGKRGVPDQHANDAAKAELEENPQWRPTGPRTERGRGPKSEREEPGST